MFESQADRETVTARTVAEAADRLLLGRKGKVTVEKLRQEVGGSTTKISKLLDLWFVDLANRLQGGESATVAEARSVDREALELAKRLLTKCREASDAAAAEQVKNERVALAKAKEDAERSIELAKREVAAKNEEVERLSESVRALQAQREALEAERCDLRAKVASTEQRLESTEKLVRLKEAAAAEARAEVDRERAAAEQTLKAAELRHSEERKGWLKQIDAARLETESAKAKERETAGRVKTAEERLAEAEQRLVRLDIAVEAESSARGAALRRAESAEAEVQKLRQELEGARQDALKQAQLGGERAAELAAELMSKLQRSLDDVAKLAVKEGNAPAERKRGTSKG